MIICFILFLHRFLCWVQTGNLCRGETTSERYARSSYKEQHRRHVETISLVLSNDSIQKKRMSIMCVDDNTNPEGKT